ncbi:hypothetical protein HDA40_005546 [Hamadaea flava]|uniref:Uncharacterized protein n=1 Tax=Hamadaea flava TaxID=1742688 RepID=A0ABV8LR48_9ACTN|nr:hypothetical protein [Hamadaea flava]MCP2327039.1 hypothetical protein [Hamadaea flava]
MSQVGYGAGFAQHTTYNGNYSVIIPWPAGGFAEYWFDRTTRVWNGPVITASAKLVSSVSFFEGDYASADNDGHFNFELIAVEDGTPIYWFRENQAPFTWHRLGPVPQAPTDTICALIGRTHFNPEHAPRGFHEDIRVFSASGRGGISVSTRTTEDDHLTWGRPSPAEVEINTDRRHAVYEVGAGGGADGAAPLGYGDGQLPVGAIGGVYSGIAWARGTFGEQEVDFADSRYGRGILITVDGDGALFAYECGREIVRVDTGLRGRPAIIQTDRGRLTPAFAPGTHGQYELFAPSLTGGVRHYWRTNGEHYGTPGVWNRAPDIGTELYDEVSVIQLNDEDKPDPDRTPPLWLFGRINGQPWVDVFQQRHVPGATLWEADRFIWERLPGLGGDRRPEVWEVTCVKRWPLLVAPGEFSRVVGLGGVRDGQAWSANTDEAKQHMLHQERRYLVHGDRGAAAWVQVSPQGYLTTTPDGIAANNLERLPVCAGGGNVPAAAPALAHPVGGLIGAKFAELGGVATFGQPTSPEASLTGGTDRRQTFEWGQIGLSPRQGARMLTWAYRDGNDVIFGWGPTDPYNYDLFIVRYSTNRGLPVPPDYQIEITDGPRTAGQIVVPRPMDWIGGDGRTAGWSFIVEGADRSALRGTTAIQGWTIPLNIRL